MRGKEGGSIRRVLKVWEAAVWDGREGYLEDAKESGAGSFRVATLCNVESCSLAQPPVGRGRKGNGGGSTVMRRRDKRAGTAAVKMEASEEVGD